MERTDNPTLPDASPPDYLIDARFVLPPAAPAQERREFLYALGLAVGDRPIPDLPEGTEAEVSFALAAVPRSGMHRQLELLRTTLPSLVLEELPVGTLDAREADDDVDDEWDEDTMVEWGEDEDGNPLGVAE